MSYLNVEGGEGDEGVVVDERAEGLVEFAKLLAEGVGVESVQQVVQVAHIRKELQIERCVLSVSAVCALMCVCVCVVPSLPYFSTRSILERTLM